MIRLKEQNSLFQGYTYSVFNLVYETNTPSIRIWDSLGFKRIGRIKGAGNLRSHSSSSSPSTTYVDAIIYGRDLGPEGEDFVSEERFEKIRYYLKTGRYPQGADRLEKSRLRSAAMHYRLIPAADEGDQHHSAEEQRRHQHQAEGGERLMLKDKEVVSDPQRQYSIARTLHINQAHAGINKTTASIAERFHWVRIKETVSLVIKNCGECTNASPSSRTVVSTSGSLPNHSNAIIAAPCNSGDGVARRTASHENSSGTLVSSSRVDTDINHTAGGEVDPNSMIERLVDFHQISSHPIHHHHHHQPPPPSPSPSTRLKSESHHAATPMAHMQIQHTHFSNFHHQQQQQQQQQNHEDFPLDPAILHPASNSQSNSPQTTDPFHSSSPLTPTIITATTASGENEEEEANLPSDEDMLQNSPHPEFIHLNPLSDGIDKFSHVDVMDTDDSAIVTTATTSTIIISSNPNTNNKNEFRKDQIRGVFLNI